VAQHSDVKKTMKYAHIGISDGVPHFRRRSVSFAVIGCKSGVSEKSEILCGDRKFFWH
jgi:hypothetical protein